MILTVCLSPCIDVTVELDALEIGKTNVAKGKRMKAAGKAMNVAKDVAALGGRAFMTGFMYRESRLTFESILLDCGVQFDFLMNDGRVRENYKFIDNKSMLTEVNSVSGEVSKESAERLLDKIAEHSKRCAVTVISGSQPKGVDGDYYGKLLSKVSPSSLKVADASGEKLLAALKIGVDLVKPNLDELETTLQQKFSTEEEMLEGCKQLVKMGSKLVLLSLGKRGAILTDGTNSYYCKSSQVAVNSTVGAGDAMVAAAALAMERSAPMQEILRAGVAAGTAAVTTFDENVFPAEKCAEIYKNLVVTEIE